MLKQDDSSNDIYRVLIYLTLLFTCGKTTFYDYQYIDSVFFRVNGIFNWLPLSTQNLTWIQQFAPLKYLFFSLGLIGLFGRLTHFLSFIWAIFLLGINQNFFKIAHNGTLITFVLFLFILYCPNNKYSLDGWLRKKRKMPRLKSSKELLPLSATMLITCYFIAGIQKLRFLVPLIWDNPDYPSLFFKTLNGPLAHIPELLSPLATVLLALLILLQLSTPFALTQTKARFFIPALLITFHTMGYLLARDNFLLWLPLYFSFVSVDGISIRSTIGLNYRAKIFSSLFIIGHLWCAVALVDFWPFGKYTMYAKSRFGGNEIGIQTQYKLSYHKENVSYKFKRSDYPLSHKRIIRAMNHFIRNDDSEKLERAFKSLIDYKNMKEKDHKFKLRLTRHTLNIKTQHLKKEVIWQQH